MTKPSRRLGARPILGVPERGQGTATELFQRLQSALAERYAIERELGRGGMATVYLAQDLKHDRRVAIKVLQPELANAIGPERFLREIKLTAQLNHPHILPLLDSGEANGFLYYVMPYVAGESLRDRLNREKQLPIEDALQIAREVADALDYAHTHNVVHRDIKPENILLEGKHGVVADFGIARAISVAGGEKLTGTGVAVGTPEYMSPEQASGRGELDGRSDVYALGCVLHEMLAGQPPFMGPTVEAVLRQHLTAPAPIVTAIRAAVPEPAARAIQRALAKTPADRFPTAAQFAAAMKETAPVSPWWQSKRAAAIAALVALAAAGSWAVGRARSPAVSKADEGLPRLAVLPFENVGAPEDEDFADGMTDEIMTRLAGLSGLAVISPQSVMGYKGTAKKTAEIGRELDVKYLLQAKIRWQRLPDGSTRVRVTPRLIRVADDRLVWADDFDEVLEDVFRVQGQIAVQVASALGVALLSREQEAVTRRLTQNVAAYERYLKMGKAGFPAYRDWRETVAALENAITLDTGFAEAYARLSIAHGYVRWQDWDPSHDAEHLARERQYAARALALDPGLPEGHAAMGWYHYMGQHDFQRALQEFRIALAAEPNNAFFISGEATVYKRTGDFAAAAHGYARASDLDPLNGSAAEEAGVEYMLLRRYGDAERYFVRAAAIGGRTASPHLAYLRLMRDGDPRSLRAWLDTALGSRPFPDFIRVAAHGGGWGYWRGPLTRTLCGECDAAIPLIGSVRERDWQRYLAIALLHERAGRLDEARTYYDSARVRQEGLGPGFPPFPPSGYAKLGRKDQALRAAIEHLERTRQRKEVFAETEAMSELAGVYMLVGEHDAALEQLEWLLSHPSFISVPLLRADPLYDPLRSNPRFQALLTKYDNRS